MKSTKTIGKGRAPAKDAAKDKLARRGAKHVHAGITRLLARRRTEASA